MRKLCIILLCLVLCMGYYSALAEVHPAHLTVAATTYPLYDIAYQLGGGHLNVVYMPDADAETIGDADILLCMGGEKDAWTTELENVTVVRAMDGIELIENDEDILTIPVNVMIVAAYFSDALVIADNAHVGLYGEKLGNYIDALGALDMSFREVVKEGTKVFCEDGSMAYFAKEYGVEIVDEAEDAVVLSTYNYPAETDLTTSYVELMQRNLEMLTKG